MEAIPMNDILDKSIRDDDDDDDDDDDGFTDGPEATLLGHHLPHPAPPPKGLWSQIQGIVIESAPALTLTTVSLLFTGKLLEQVSHWRAMREIDQLIIIIPVVLNLKGNLEMNLSARLGTAANVGELDEPKRRRRMILGNLALLQVQAMVVSFVAACFAILLGLIVHPLPESAPLIAQPSSNSTAPSLLMRDLFLYSRKPIPHPHPEAKHTTDLATFAMVASSTMTAACLSGLLLDSFMCALIVLCRKFHRDPDNIAPAIASCLGDLVTLSLIGLVSGLLIPYLHTPLPFIVAIVVILTSLTSLIYTLRNECVRPLLGQGWSPLFGAMILSSGSGIILDLFVGKYTGYAVIAVIIAGLPGATGSIFVSRLSTALHAAAISKSAQLSEAQSPSPKVVTLTLLAITLPIEIFFLTTLRGIGWLKVPYLFIAFSVLFFCTAVTISLIIARYLTNWLWSKKRDPDMYALPIHSAFVDVMGQLLLVLCFEIVSGLGGNVTARGA
ncbi:hypothetical protein AGABI2DRAFT_217440 [Agaricus bisporus var. bisporus H97]|uniref:hypothetical protein n=1 Tax=Agaricus bisporus var. bisporus (strain H97 / ATCC MYA-4626 / FGSC 10389) TaxID=936046 RepID=UPI00029F7943|nr:hypothetical protein AGABI2DRAFT_217440 [Agaricus bisporus var. bisporus H97]EKV50625.1 hypothetical protein AGABI2DRAFT_217440 [Agaricus bisporus var. bisporus H97]